MTAPGAPSGKHGPNCNVVRWTCRKCGRRMATRLTQRCFGCGAPRPKAKRASHKIALDHPYEHYVEINGGDHCGVCGRKSSPVRRLDRDHDHRTGEPRGLLCATHNRMLKARLEPEIRKLVEYLDRHAERIRNANPE